MNYNYHTHTFRCNHASGEDEEYVIRAIEGGIKYMGFSDHMPLKFSDGTQSRYRVPLESAEEYCNSIKSLADKYKDEIDIKVGFELEYYECCFNEMVKNAIEYGAEYLIVGQHFTLPENTGVPGTIIETSDKAYLEQYVECILSAIKSGYITYIAHPDIINFIGDESYYLEKITEIAVASKKYDVPLEINFLGMRKNRLYPARRFWKIVGKIGSPVTFGCDAHSPNDVYDPESVMKAKAIVKDLCLNYIGIPKIIDIRKKADLCR